MSLVFWAGLVFGIIGPGMVILPTFKRVQSLLIDEDKVEALRNGRQKLSNEGQLFSGDPGFDAVCRVIEQNWDQALSAKCEGLHRPKIVFEDTRGHEMYNRILTVYSVNSDAIGEDNPSSEHYIQDIESLLTIDSWIDDEINYLTASPVQRVRGLGFGVIVISVTIQVWVATL